MELSDPKERRQNLYQILKPMSTRPPKKKEQKMVLPQKIIYQNAVFAKEKPIWHQVMPQPTSGMETDDSAC